MSFAERHTSPQDRLRQALRALVAGASVEVTPREILAGKALAVLPWPGIQVYVPFLPRSSFGADFGQTVAACSEVASRGFEAVPHIPARAVESLSQLRETLAALRQAGVQSLLLIAGDRAKPAGPFRDTLALLESGVLDAERFQRLGVAGHPEGHPAADVVQLDHALRVKIEYARATGTQMWVVSQFAFGSAQVIAWLERLRGKGVELPVRVGIAGPAGVKTVLKYASYCGVEASARMLARRPGAARLLGRWTPDDLAHDLAGYRLNHPGSLLEGIHVYTFGGVARTSRWLRKRVPEAAFPGNVCNSEVA